MPAKTGSDRRMSAARVAGIRCWPHSWSGSATAEQAMPVNTTAKTASALSVPTPCPAAGATDSSATAPSCMVPNCSGFSRFVYALM